MVGGPRAPSSGRPPRQAVAACAAARRCSLTCLPPALPWGHVPLHRLPRRRRRCHRRRRLVNDRETGKPRGFGFIEFFDIPTAESAIRNLSGKDFKGRMLRWVGGFVRWMSKRAALCGWRGWHGGGGWCAGALGWSQGLISSHARRYLNTPQ